VKRNKKKKKKKKQKKNEKEKKNDTSTCLKFSNSCNSYLIQTSIPAIPIC